MGAARFTESALRFFTRNGSTNLVMKTSPSMVLSRCPSSSDTTWSSESSSTLRASGVEGRSTNCFVDTRRDNDLNIFMLARGPLRVGRGEPEEDGKGAGAGGGESPSEYVPWVDDVGLEMVGKPEWSGPVSLSFSLSLSLSLSLSDETDVLGLGTARALLRVGEKDLIDFKVGIFGVENASDSVAARRRTGAKALSCSVLAACGSGLAVECPGANENIDLNTGLLKGDDDGGTAIVAER